MAKTTPRNAAAALGNNLGAAAAALGGEDAEFEAGFNEEAAPSRAELQAQIDKLQAQMAALSGGAVDTEREPTAAPAAPTGNDAGELHRQRAEKKVVIIIEENDHTPPGGHFVGVNGVGYQIQVGKEVTVPRSVLEVLDNAKESVPQTDPNTNSVIGFRDRLRVPYRVVKFLD